MSWVPIDACSLPTPEQPLRRRVRRPVRRRPAGGRDTEATTAVLRLAPGAAARAADLAGRETACCSFFAFDVRAHDDGAVVVTVTVPPDRADVLAGLAVRARALLPSAP